MHIEILHVVNLLVQSPQILQNTVYCIAHQEIFSMGEPMFNKQLNPDAPITKHNMASMYTCHKKSSSNKFAEIFFYLFHQTIISFFKFISMIIK